MICEVCSKEIKDGEKWYVTGDECNIHEKCYPREQFIADTECETFDDAGGLEMAVCVLYEGKTAWLSVDNPTKGIDTVGIVADRAAKILGVGGRNTLQMSSGRILERTALVDDEGLTQNDAVGLVTV